MNPGMVGVFIPIVAVGGFFLWMISLSPLGRALAERLKHGPIRGGTGGSGISSCAQSGSSAWWMKKKAPAAKSIFRNEEFARRLVADFPRLETCPAKIRSTVFLIPCHVCIIWFLLHNSPVPELKGREPNAPH